MEDDSSADLLAQAREMYRHVDADPAAYASPAAALVARARDAGQPATLVTALRAQAWAERGGLANTRAKALLDEAARIARAHGLAECLGDVLVTRAAVNLELGRPAAARHDLRAAVPLVRGASARQRHFQEAVLHHNSGRLTRAAVLYRGLLAHRETAVDIRGKVGNNLAMIEAQRGRTESALRCLDDAAKAAVEVGPALTASVLQTRGWVCVRAGRLAEGLRLFEDATRLFESSGLPLGELHMEYADALVDLRLLPEAATATTRAVRQFEASGVRLMAAEAQLRSARLSLLLGEPDRARASAQDAAATFRRQRRPAWAARADVVAVEAGLAVDSVTSADVRAARHAAATLERLGDRAGAVHAHLTAGRVALGLNRNRAAREGLRRSRELSQGAPVLVRLDGRIAAAKQAELEGRDADVTRHCRAGLADLARHRNTLASMELRALASGHGVELARTGLEVALRSGSASTVLQWMERTRASAQTLVAPAAPDGLDAEQAALRALHAEMADAARQDPEEQAMLLAEQRDIEDRLRRAAWSAGPGTASPARPVRARELHRALAGRVLVEYGVLRGELFAVVLEPRASRVVPLGKAHLVDEQNDVLMFALRRLSRPRPAATLAAARATADDALHRLTESLLTPLGLAPDVPLVIVPSAVLHGLPWAALHDAPVTLAPSASSWATTLPDGQGPAGSVVLVAGPDLPGAVEEVTTLAGVHREATVLAPPSSTVDAVAEALDGAAVAHLACHGRLRADNPMFSSLFLSDGPLTLQEMDRRGLAPRRIVLASCESGASVRYDGDELLGFVGALIARGTVAVVASAVLVPDVESVPLMAALHGQVARGASLGEALHAARARVDVEAPTAFVTWCAYNAYGAA